MSELSGSTVWLKSSVSWPPKFRYWRRNIGHTESVSSCCAVPGWSTQVLLRLEPPQRSELNGAVLSVASKANVELAGLPQSVVNAQISTRSAPPNSAPSNMRAKKFGVPAGGAVPSASAGRNVTAGDAAVNAWNVAGFPLSMFARSKTIALSMPPG